MSTRIMHCKVYRYCNINVISQKNKKITKNETIGTKGVYTYNLYIYMYKLYLEPCTVTVHAHLSKLV